MPDFYAWSDLLTKSKYGQATSIIILIKTLQADESEAAEN
jgi:hypothetical protein